MCVYLGIYFCRLHKILLCTFKYLPYNKKYIEKCVFENIYRKIILYLCAQHLTFLRFKK